MVDPVTIPLTVVAASPTPPAEPPRSGIKTTELWVAMFLLAGVGVIIEQLIPLIPTLAANPSMPPWVSAVVPLAIGALGWAGKGVAQEYMRTRVALKLPTPQVDVTAAVAAGAAAANASNDKVLAALNK